MSAVSLRRHYPSGSIGRRCSSCEHSPSQPGFTKLPNVFLLGGQIVMGGEGVVNERAFDCGC
jgi:hypothetical protein